jgi:hypothetical protein
MTKWKIGFFISLTITLLTVLACGYIILTNTLSSGHNRDNLITLTEDIEHISTAIKNRANTIDEFDRELRKDNSGHWTDKENNIIRLQIAHILFDSDGKFKKIETYFLNQKGRDK